MAVPNTNTFKLSDVCNELNLSGSDRKLSVCFSSANTNYFNSAYEGSKDRLSNFRDYGSHNGSSSFDVIVVVEAELFSGDTVECVVNLRDTSGLIIDNYSYRTTSSESHTFSISMGYYMDISSFSVNRLKAKPMWSDDDGRSWNYTSQSGTYTGAESFKIRKSNI